MRRSLVVILVAVLLAALAVPPSQAGVRSAAVREASEYVSRKFSREVAEEFGEAGAAALARRMEQLAARYGDELVTDAARKVGPQLFRLLDDVGESGAPAALRLLARRGDEAVWVVARPKSFALFLKHGDEAADALIRHREIAEPLIEHYGAPMTRALLAVDGQGGRRLAMLAEEGFLSKVAQRQGLLDAIGRHGDRAMDWVWRNKGALLTAAVVTAFVADPEPFITGAVDVVEIGGDKLVRPVAQAAAQSLNWNLIIGLPLVALVLVYGARVLWRRSLAAIVPLPRRKSGNKR